MFRIIDRYVIREVLPPFLIVLLVFTFVLEMQPIMDMADKLIAKGVAWACRRGCCRRCCRRRWRSPSRWRC